MADMRKQDTFRPGIRCDFESLFDGEVGRVRFVAQGIDHKELDVAGRFVRFRRNRVAIRVVGQQSVSASRKNVAGGVEPSMRKLHRHNVEIAQLKGPRDFADLRADVIPEHACAAVESKREDPLQVVEHGRCRIDRHVRRPHLAKSPNVVEAHDVIRVRVGEQDRVDAMHLFAQALRPEVRGSVYYKLDFRSSYSGRRAQSPVPWIVGMTDCAVARDHWDALRSARSEERDFEGRGSFHLRNEAVIFADAAAMLASFRIRNFALVESLEWEIPPGFVAITGETGAGKSILIGGLQLLLGERADRSAVRCGESEAMVEAVIELPSDSTIHALLENSGVDPCEDGRLLLKRVVPAAGAGRQFANGSPCTLALLRSIGDRLVDLHGPHDHQSLFSREAQTRVLDSFAGCTEQFAKYRQARQRWVDLQREQAESESDLLAREREIDLLNHQVSEIEGASLRADEEESLVARQQTSANAHRLGEISAGLTAALSESEDSQANRLADILRLARELARLDPSQGDVADRLLAMSEETADIARDLASYANGLDVDPAALAAVESRLDVIQGLKRKYGATVQAVIEFGERAAERLADLRAASSRREGLAEAIAEARGEMLAAGGELSKRRASAAPRLATSVRKHLRDLGFLKVGFEVDMKVVEAGSDGLEEIEFVFAPNPGEPAQALRAIASSGEISRVMLALKTSLASQDEIPILVFDEIDANVGGEVANAVAAKMQEIGKSRQVLCITHLPQVASAAPAHFVVRKSVTGGRTLSTVDRVHLGDREEEVARMLGSRKGEAALAHARDLLGA